MLNAKLCRIHRLFAIAYGSLLAFFAVLSLGRSGDFGSIEPLLFFAALLGPMFVVHLLAMWGASRGESWARWLSRIVGFVMLFGVPIGTVVGYFLLKYAGATWEAAPGK